MRFVAGQGAGAQNHREANPAQVRQIACQGAGAQSHREDVAGRGAAKKPPVTALWGTRYWERTQGDVPPGNALLRERTVRRILFAGFEALCVFSYLELVYHLLNLTIHKDR